MSWDAIIVGGGHNGLTCAAYLARAGRKVLVLERRHLVGGAAVSEEVYPGFTYTVCSYVVSLLRPHILRDLQLARHGLELVPLESTFTPFPDGRSLARWSDPYRTRAEIARFSQRDADRYPEFGLAMGKLARFAKPIIDQRAPDLGSLRPNDLMQLLGLARHARGLGDDLAALQVKLATMSAVDFLSEWFESEALIAPMACSGIIGTFLSVTSPGSAYVLLHHYMGEIDGASRAWAFPRGGTGAVSRALADSARSFGAEIRVNAEVERVILERGRAVGVALAGSGDELRAKVVISGADPHRTMFGMVGERHLPAEFVRGLKRYKYRGSSGKVNIALDRLPEFTCRPGTEHLRMGDVNISPSVEYLETAYNEAKYGDFSSRPFMNIVYPSLLDPSMAPEGKHVMSVFVQYAPYQIKEGPEHWPERREAFGEAVLSTLEQYCPTIRGDVRHMQVLSPWDLEQQIGLTEGNIFHGELNLEQLLFQRPVSGWARYRTPVQGLWMCASGTHPGGGIMGAPGHLAALELLQAGEV
jgi:phytoene dehydrogenase-like protein